MSSAGTIRRTPLRLAVLEHLDRHGRTDLDTVAREYMQHVSGTPTNPKSVTTRTCARQLLRRLDQLGLVRMFRDESARITAEGRRFLYESE